MTRQSERQISRRLLCETLEDRTLLAADSLLFLTDNQSMWSTGDESLVSASHETRFEIIPENASDFTLGGINTIPNPARAVWDKALQAAKDLVPDIVASDADVEKFLTETLDEITFGLPNPLGGWLLGPWKIKGLGSRPPATIQDGTQLTIDAGLELGVDLSLDITPGRVDVRYPTEVTLDVVGEPKAPGDELIIRTSEVAGDAGMTTEFPQIEASLAGFIDLHAKANLTHKVLGVSTLDNFEMFNVDTGPYTQEILSATAGTDFFQIDPLGLEGLRAESFPFGMNLNFPVPGTPIGFPLADVNLYPLHLDTPDAEHGNTSVFQDGVITNTQIPDERSGSGEIASDFFRVDLDLDSLSLLASAPLGFEVGDPYQLASIEVNFLDGDLAEFYGIGQTMQFTPELTVTLEFSTPVITETEPGSGVFGEEPVTNITIPVGADLRIQHPGKALDIKPSYSLKGSTFANDTDLYRAHGFTLSFLQLKVGGILPTALGVDQNFHIYEDTFDIGEPVRVQLSDPTPFEMQGFADLPGTTVEIPSVSNGLLGSPGYVVGPGAGGSGQVSVYHPDGSLNFGTSPFPTAPGGVRVAMGDVNGDGIHDVITGTGPGVAPEVRIFDGATQSLIHTIPAFEARFLGGVYVAVGDTNADGFADIAITPDEGGGPRVRVFSGNGFGQLADFFGIDDPNFRGGARTSLGDLNGDGVEDLIVAAGFGGGPRVAGFDGNSLGGNLRKLFNDFFAFEPGLRNGAFVASGDVDGDGFADLISGGGPGGGPRVLALSGADLLNDTQRMLANFFAGDTANRGGIRVTIANLDDDPLADIVTGAGDNAGSTVTSYLGKDLLTEGSPNIFRSFEAFAGFLNGVFVG